MRHLRAVALTGAALVGLASAARAQVNVTVGNPPMTMTQPAMPGQPGMVAQPPRMMQPMAPMAPAYVDQSVTQTTYARGMSPAPMTYMAPAPGTPMAAPAQTYTTTTYATPAPGNYTYTYTRGTGTVRRGPFAMFRMRRASRGY